jgi:2Fe-2S ferredoxin
MVKITFVEANGEQQTVDAKLGQSIMEAATKSGVPGILADCGGAAACGTCRIYVEDAAYRAKMPPISELEQAMIDFADDQTPHVRLSCQLRVVEAYDGLTVRLPTSQHG